jgi:ABC-type cobalamin transport system ATPase subunit
MVQKYQRSPLFDMNVFQYVTLLQIDFDIKFNVINFETISWLDDLCTAVSL